MTKAHGQETTRKISALCSHVAKEAEKPDSEKSGGRKVSRRAAETTIGV